MKYLPFKTLVIGLAACLAGLVSAQTTYQGTGSGSALDIATSGNWSNGLPTSSGNLGTINTNSSVNASSTTPITNAYIYTGYYLKLTGGTMTQFNSGNDPTFSGGTFTVDGGTYGATAGTGRGFRTDASNVATLTSGKINSGSTANGGANIQGGSSLIINGGEFQQWGASRNIRLTGSSSLTVNPGGTLSMDTTSTATGTLGVNNLSDGSNTITLNGGTTTANFLSFGNNATTPRLKLTLGGTTAGTLTAVNFQTLSTSEVIGARRIDWLPGTLMTMRISGADEWAEAEWDAGRLLYNGQTKTDLGGLSWANAINSTIGVGGGYYFVYNSGTETLSLASSGGDVTPPEWTSTWPKVDTQTTTGFTVRANTNEAGTAYYVVLADGATAPSAAEVKAGTAAGGGSALANGSISLTANNESTAAVTGLTEGTAYDVYFVAEDAVPNLQASPVKVDVTTLALPPTWADTWPKIDTVGTTTFTARAKTDENGTAYYVVLADGANAPSAAQVKAGNDISNAPALKSGSISLTANNESTAAVTGLTVGTAYDVYFVAEDAVPNLQASPVKVDVTTLTPYQDWAAGFAPDDVSDPTLDFDSDGLSNLLEFAFGTNPTESDAGALTWNGASFTPGSPVVNIEYPEGGGVNFTARIIRRTDHGDAGSVAYAWEFSSNMSDWESSDDAPAPDWLEEPDVLATDGDYELVEIPYPFFLDNGKKARFFRVKVTPVP